MAFDQSKRMEQVQPSPIRKVLDKAKKMQAEGRSIIHLEIGEPDFPTPAPIAAWAKQFMDSGDTHYTPNRGVKELLEAISADQARRNGVKYDPAEEIIVTIGVAEALFDTIFAYINPGDEVLGFTPAFMNYATDVAMAGGVYVPVPLHAANGFQADCEALEAKITGKTKMLILCNPCNPSGTVLSDQSLKNIADIAIRHDLLVISDEIYDRLVYCDKKPSSIASLPGMKERTILLNGFSKVFAMTGWRMGYLATHKPLIGPILRVHQYLTTCLPAFAQKAVALGLGDPETQRIVDDMVDEFHQRRDLVAGLLADIPNVSFVTPQGAFYLLLNVSATGLSGAEFAERLLEEKGVALVPALAFGQDYADFVRISYAASRETIAEGIKRIGEFVRGL